MDIKDLIYNNKDKIGLKQNISFKEIIELENFIKNITSDNNINKDIEKVVKISIEMTNLLLECRKHKLPIKLAEKIDNLLNEINNL
jgi:hypothetical protein